MADRERQERYHSYEVARALGITQKSAWFMMHRVRLAMKSCAFLHLGGEGKEVEGGRNIIGGAARFMHKAKRDRVITARGFKTRLRHSASWSAAVRFERSRFLIVASTLCKLEIRKHVAPKSFLATDALLSYQGLSARLCPRSH